MPHLYEHKQNSHHEPTLVKKHIWIYSMLLWMWFVLTGLAAKWQFAATAYWMGNRWQI